MTEPSSRLVCTRCRSVFRGGYRRCPRDGHALDPRVDDALSGTVLAGKYLVRRSLGEGGAGIVYEAVDTRLGRRYAVKALFGDLAVHPDMHERFRREAMAAGKLSHPNVCGVIDFSLDEEDEPAFLVMELAEGPTLAEMVVDGGPLPEARLRPILLGTARGLAHAHEHDIVHRDVKPNNVILEAQSGRTRLVDFGVSRVDGRAAQTQLTGHGVVIGTPGFIAPEALQGRPATPRSDLFGLGMTAIYALLGRLPLPDDTDGIVRETLAGIDTSDLDHLDLSDEFRDLVRRLVARTPEARPTDAAEVARMLGGEPVAGAVTRDVFIPPSEHRTTDIRRLALRTDVRHAAWALVGLLVVVGALAYLDDAPPAPEPATSAPPALVTTSSRTLTATRAVSRGTAAEATPAPRSPVSARAEVAGARAPAKPVKRRAKARRQTRASARASTRAPERAAPDAAPDVATLSATYRRIATALEALEARRGAEAAAPLRARYFDVPFADALRRPERRAEVQAQLRRIEADIAKAR